MDVLFVCDSIVNPNWGDRAATISLKAMIEDRGGHIIRAITEEELAHTTFGEDASSLRDRGHPGARAVLKQFIPPIVLTLRRRLSPNVGSSPTRALIPERWEGFDKAAEEVVGKRDPWPALRRAMTDADLVVIHGDGAIVGDRIMPRTQLFLGYLAKRYFDTPVIMVNHTVDLENPTLRAMVEGVYPLLDDVVYRDPISAEQCRTICQGRYAPDTAFWFEPASREAWTSLAGRPTYFDVWPDAARFDPAEPYLCIGGSSLLGGVGESTSIVAGYVSLIRRIQSHYAGTIVLTVSDLMDQAMFRAVTEATGLPLIGLSTPVQQAVDLLGNADAYIGGRWHPGIFALRGGTPVVPLSAKTFKMRALSEMAGLTSPTFDVFNLEAAIDPITRYLIDLLEHGSVLRNRLRGWADEQAKGAWDNVRYLEKSLVEREKTVR